MDAHNAQAVARLRQRKAREAKPLAVMTVNEASARLWGEFDDTELGLLRSPARPIVLARKTERCRSAFSFVADGLNEIGLMTAYTPVHLLLFHALIGQPQEAKRLDIASDTALVMTSAHLLLASLWSFTQRKPVDALMALPMLFSRTIAR